MKKIALRRLPRSAMVSPAWNLGWESQFDNGRSQSPEERTALEKLEDVIKVVLVDELVP